MTLARSALPASFPQRWILPGLSFCILIPAVLRRSVLLLGTVLPSVLLPGTLASQKLEPSANLVLLHFNDYHGQVQPLAEGLGGFGVLASFVREQRSRAQARGADILVLDAGDWFQGTPEGNESRGSLVVKLMNRLGVDAAVLGNHEFDFGHERTRELAAQAGYPVLAANLTTQSSHRVVPWVRPYIVRSVAGMRIGILGLITKRTRLVSTGPFGELRYEDEIETLQRWMPRLRADCDAIILLTHCGLARDKQLAEAFPSVQLILGGHSHTSLKRPVQVGSTWIVQTGARSKEADRIQLRVDPLRRRIRLLRGDNLPLLASRYPPDPAVLAWLDRETATIRARWDRPIGQLVGDFGSRRNYGSTAAGNLVSDLIRQAAKAQIGVQNKGGLRTRLRSGPLTLRLAFQLLPFDNSVVSMDLTGAQIRSVLREGIEQAGRPFEVSGMRYEVNRGEGGPELGRMWIVSDEASPGGKPAGKPAGREAGRQVEIQPKKVYRVATNSFLAAGGDGASSFKLGLKRVQHRALLRDLLIEAAKERQEIRASTERRIILPRAQ